jgi:hypothetical protein
VGQARRTISRKKAQERKRRQKISCPLEYTGTYGLFRHNGIERSLRMGKSLCGSRTENQLSLDQGFRLMSAHTLSIAEGKIWVITEADRSSTTVLLAEEY